MTVDVHSLAAFRRFLALPGATVQVIQNDWMDAAKTAHPIKAKDIAYWEPKTVQTLAANTVQFSTGGWLTFPKAAHVRFAGDTMTICMQQDGSFRERLVYRLTFPEGIVS